MRLTDYLGDGDGKSRPAPAAANLETLTEKVRAAIETEPRYFAELAEIFEGEGFQAVARALGELHVADVLWQDSLGRLCLKDSSFAASPPQH